MLKFHLVLVLSVIACASGAKLTILHYNDIDSQLEPFQNGTDPPVVKPPNNVGGISKLIAEIKSQSARIEVDDNVISIATANLVGGQNGWLSTFGQVGWKTFGGLLNSTYNSTLMGLGLREFESDLPRTVEYLKAGGQRPIISNIDAETCKSGKDEAEFCSLFDTHRIMDLKGGIKYGVVGFVNPTVEKLSDAGKLKFLDIGSSLSTLLQNPAFNDVKTVIAIGSGSTTISRDIIDKLKNPKLKLIIYGGIARDMTLTYPESYQNVHIVTGLKYGQALGKVVLDFTADGEATVNKGSSKLIPISDQSPDLLVVHTVNELSKIVANKTVDIGKTVVRLEGAREACWRAECNLGNLVADAMVHCAVNAYNDTAKHPEIAGVVAVWHSGAVFDDTVEPNNVITSLDVHKWLPYHNNAYLVATKGKFLKKMFETSGTAMVAGKPGYEQTKDWGQFLQVSNGFEVQYTVNGELKSLRTLKLEGSKPLLVAVQDEDVYNFVIPSILYKGKSLYDFLPNNFEKDVTGSDFISLGFDDICLENYIRGVKVLKIGFEERIFVVDGDGPSPPGPEPGHHCSSNTAVTVILTLVISAIIVGLVIVGWKVVWPKIQQRGRHSSFP